MDKTWFVYLLRGRQRRFYCGITTDLERRVWEHNNDPKRASKCAWACRPLVLVWSIPVATRGEATRIERRVKKLRKPDKIALVEGTRTLEELP